MVNVMAITLQGHFSPYVCDIDDKLSVMFLVNEFVLIVSLLGVTHVDGWNSDQNGIVLLVIQGLLSAYLAYIIWTVKARPLYEGCKEACTRTLAKCSSIHKRMKSIDSWPLQDGGGQVQMHKNVTAPPASLDSLAEAPPLMIDNDIYANNDVELSMLVSASRKYLL
mmetsp:Transcript_7114/g.12318  ORF Transcript_7114/g.12318 Transcript_7114/m.12318 type:complete len:166 (+) Transcript_7114:110-607(+)